MIAEFRPESFPRPAALTRKDTIRGVNRAVYTLFVTPEHEKLHSVVAEKTTGEFNRQGICGDFEQRSPCIGCKCVS